MSFVHLHVHSEYSLLDGFSNIKKLTKRAKELGMPAIALTDHGSMFGVIDFFNRAREAGVKPIIGVEIYLAPRRMQDKDVRLDKSPYHLLLLAQNQTGYQNLLKIASAAQLEGFYYYPRTDHEFLAAHSEGLLCTTGCMSGEVPSLLIEKGEPTALRALDWYMEVFGRDRFFFELQEHQIPELPVLNQKMIELSRRYNGRLIATNDCHYINPEDARLQDIMLCVQTGSLVSTPDRMRMTDNSYYLRPPEEMARLFAEVPEAIDNTLWVAEQCEVDLSMKGYHLPLFDVPADCDAACYLRQLCEEGMQRRYGERASDPELRQRLDYELKVIHEMGFDTYFLIVWDLCRYAAEHGIWYNVRGSGNGSVVAYVLDITLVEPLEQGLIFERFLNPGRVSMPDIDLDFQDDRRAEMMEYCARKYGHDRVAQIITFGTLGARAALRDVGRVMDIPLSEVDRIAKLVPNIPGKPVTLTEALEQVPELKAAYEEADYLRELIDTAAQVEGVVRNAGTHAAGVVITDKPLVEYTPLHRPTSGSEESPIKSVVQFEMSIIDSLGLLKVDFLGLATLTIMQRAADLIAERRGIRYTLANIPLDDPQTYEMLGAGKTAGVFQLEGSGMTRWLMQMKPKSLANIIAMVALFRPGPMDFIPAYVHRMHGVEKVAYPHELLVPIFKETYGIPIYQEQIMFAAMEMAGYTASEADDLRRAISKKKADALMKHRQKFITGAAKKNIPEITAAQIFEDWENFARYGFNKCLPGNVEVVDAASGRLVRIEDLFTGKQTLTQTITCDTSSFKLRTGRVSRVMANGVKPVYRLITTSGREIEATANHPFYTYAGWRLLEKLKPGDLIAVPRTLPVEGKQHWADHEVIALGHLLAEGNLCQPHSVNFYSQNRGEVEDFIQAAEQFPNTCCSIATHRHTYSIHARRVNKRVPPGIFTWADKLGILGKNTCQKALPEAVFELNHRQLGLLISRMWAGDGHIDLPGRNLFYATASKRLAQQLQHLLLRLGVFTHLRTVIFPYNEGRTGYQLFITGNNNIQAFQHGVGVHFYDVEHQQKLQTLVLAEVPQDIGTKDIIPRGVKTLVRQARHQHGITWNLLNLATGIAQREFSPINSAGKVGFKRSTIRRLAAYFDDPALRAIAESDLYWDQIRSIEPAGEQMTYDLEVPETHNFVANDFLVHNSHAADYGVLAAQTAYLKAHYPVEYMTAVLSASKNDSAKVAFYVADCRALGIAVLPPDINHSGYDFTIEDRAGQSPAIRFGLGAVKNVGHTPVELILQARREGIFRDLNDFARRVDLHLVGKRTLECLIKVGALDAFGERAALLEALDGIVAVSASHFRALQAGQLSFFGTIAGVEEDIVLPFGATLDHREMLEWERELIGLYVSDHPLAPYLPILRQKITHFSAQLGELGNKDRVVVAGLVTRFRRHQTKDGKPMGFVTIEDIQGQIELVLFPRTWEQYGRLVEIDRVFAVEGKVDAQGGGDPKVLVDKLSLVRLEDLPAAELTPLNELPAPLPASAYEPPDYLEDANGNGDEAPVAPPRRLAEPAPEWDDIPPPPPDPEDWHLQFEPPVAAASPPSPPAVSVPTSPPAVESAPDALPGIPPALVNKPASFVPFSYIVPPAPIAPPAAAAPDQPPRMLRLVLRSCGDKLRDQRRLKRIYGEVCSHPGRDRFSLMIFEQEHYYLIDFPNDSTNICPELHRRLIDLLGEENVTIEEIKIQ